MAKENTVLTITLKSEPEQARIAIFTDHSRYERGIDIDDGYGSAADDVEDVVLGYIARNIDWEKEIEKLYG